MQQFYVLLGFSNCILMLASAPAAEDNNATAADAPADGKHTQRNINAQKIVIVLRMGIEWLILWGTMLWVHFLLVELQLRLQKLLQLRSHLKPPRLHLLQVTPTHLPAGLAQPKTKTHRQMPFMSNSAE